MWVAKAETRYLGCMKVQPRQLAKILHALSRSWVLVPQSLEVLQSLSRAVQSKSQETYWKWNCFFTRIGREMCKLL